MTYRSLLVHLDAGPRCAPRTDVAIRLARRLDCHLVGLAPTGLIDLPASIVGASHLEHFASVAWASLRDQTDLVVACFRDRCTAAGLKSFEAFADNADEAQSLVGHAHCSDLTILGQSDPATTARSLSKAIVEQVVLHSARPNLLLPYAGSLGQIGSRVMIAWDDSRESARAVADALPLLRQAEQVQIITCIQAPRSTNGGAETERPARLDAVHQWLTWHGVSADLRVETCSGSVADSLLTYAADAGIDLIVMGAYGHSRWRERVLDGATRGLMSSMTVPVLMSH